MNFPANPLAPATKDQIQTQLSAFNAVMQHTMHAAGKLNVLNMAATKASMKDSVDLMTKVIEAPEFGKAVAILHAETQPAADKASSYLRHASEIHVQAQSELAHTVQEQVHEALDHLGQLVDTFAKATPSGMEPFAASFKGQANQILTSYERLAKANQHLFEGYHQQLMTFVDHFAPAPMPAKSGKNAKADKDLAVAA